VPTKALIASGSVVVLVLLLYLMGAIGGRKVGPGTAARTANEAAPASAAVEQREVQDVIDWPGTVTSSTVANLAPKIMARVIEVRVTAGTPVQPGDVIAVLDDRELRTRAQQAKAVETAAQAQASQAQADLRRTRMLVRKQAATQQDLDTSETQAKSAEAQLAQARDAVDEGQVLLGESTLRAPFAGIVAARMADPGDMGVPGRAIAIVHDPQSLRLEVRIGERCAAAVTPGQTLRARIDSPPSSVRVHIDEIAPMADPQSRTVLVKASLDADPSLRPGTFGVLEVPCGRHSTLLVPKAAVRRTGQLESVRVVINAGEVRLRHVRSGKTFGDLVEIVSGLAPGERVAVGD
jgi:RND family efflux transporter MFP subunit